jgi:hypothetical protein
MKTMNSDPVQDYILEDENKLRIAAAVFNAWSEVRQKLVLGFLDRLKRALQLKKELEEWEFQLYQRPFIDSYAELSFGKSGWRKDYYVGLVFTEYGKEVAFGLRRDAGQKRIQNRQHCPELLPAVKKHYPSAGAYRWWEAWIGVQSLSVQPPPDDWGKPEVLWRMRDEDEAFLNEVAEHLLKVAKISEPIVDRFVERLARTARRTK